MYKRQQEVYTNANAGATSGDKQTMWQPRAVDPELEAEFLRRLMVKLGVSQEQSKALVASSAAKPTAAVTSVNGQPAVKLEEGFDRAWRRVGLALDRTGFTVEDRDRKQGIYFVRYVSTTSENTEPGFFSKLFSGSAKNAPPTKYQIAVRSQGEQSHVLVLDASGQPESSAITQRIVKVLADDIK